MATAVLQDLGVARDRIEVDRQSRNTEENARFAKVLADPKPGQRWLLVTSAFHMPRAMGIFRKVGFSIEPYPVDFKARRNSNAATLQSDYIAGHRCKHRHTRVDGTGCLSVRRKDQSAVPVAGAGEFSSDRAGSCCSAATTTFGRSPR